MGVVNQPSRFGTTKWSTNVFVLDFDRLLC